jgi:quinol monooxygenase YgiN
MADSNFAYIWRYSIKPDQRTELLSAYCSKGHWAILFSQDSDYIKTDLLQDSSDENVYLTIDYWTSKAARDAFREKFSEEFHALDQECEAYTVSEVFVGDFVIHDVGAT